MVKTILPLLQAEHVKKLVFSSAAGLNCDWLCAKNFDYINSEYQMKLYPKEPVIAENKSLTVRLATTTDIPALCALDSACFPERHSNMAARFQTLINHPKYALFIALKDELPVGKAHLRWRQHSTQISDIAITPRLQGRGLGCALLAYCINYALSHHPGDIMLEVETNNENALRLYTRLGFTITNAYDYWSLPLETAK